MDQGRVQQSNDHAADALDQADGDIIYIVFLCA